MADSPDDLSLTMSGSSSKSSKSSSSSSSSDSSKKRTKKSSSSSSSSSSSKKHSKRSKSSSSSSKGSSVIEREEQAVLLIQAFLRMAVERRHLVNKRKLHIGRSRVVREIIETERSYVKAIKLLVDLFVIPLGRDPSLMEAKDIRIVFSNIEVIQRLNDMLITELEERYATWHINQMIGDTFAKLTEFFKVYVDYIKNYEEAIMKLDECRKANSKLDTWVKTTEKRIPGSLDVQSLLITPVQRIPRYNLLLQDLVKRTWPDHPDFAKLTKALEDMKTTAAYVNNKAKEADNMGKVVSIQNSISGKFDRDLVDPQRKFIHDGELVEFIPVQKKRRDVYCILFNDLVVVTKQDKGMFRSTKKFEYKDRIPLATATAYALDADNENGIQNGFVIAGRKTTVFLSAASPEEQQVWLDKLRPCIEESVENARALEESKTHVARAKAQQSMALLADKYKSMKHRHTAAADDLISGKAEAAAMSSSSDSSCSSSTDSPDGPKLRKFTLKRHKLTTQDMFEAVDAASQRVVALEERERVADEMRNQMAAKRAKEARDQISQQYSSMKPGEKRTFRSVRAKTSASSLDDQPE